MAQQNESPASGWWFFAAALPLGVFGVLILGSDDAPPAAIGVALLGIAGVLSTIGSVAVGVTVGLRRADWLRRS